MANVIIDDKHLYDIGDALRGHYGEILPGFTSELSETLIFRNRNYDDEGNYLGNRYPIELEEFEVYFPGASVINVTFTGYSMNDAENCYWTIGYFDEEIYDSVYSGTGATVTVGETYAVNNERVYVWVRDTGYGLSTHYGYGFYATITAQDADGNPVVGGTYSYTAPNTYKPREMAAAVAGLKSIPDEGLVITGNCDYRMSNNGWNWFIEAYGDDITTTKITSANNMFAGCYDLKTVSFDMNCTGTTYANMFNGCTKLTRAPSIVFTTTRTDRYYSFNTMFTGCNYLRDVENVLSNNDLDFLTTFKHTSAYSCHMYSSLFNNCYSLRKMPSWISKLRFNEEVTAYPSTSYILYRNMFYCCYALDEVVNLPVVRCAGTQTSNMFDSTVSGCSRLKEFTFETQEDGSPYVINWKNQTINLTQAGVVDYAGDVINYNSGITSDKLVDSAADYAALKNDEDWFTTVSDFSRYNHDSAVNTINSLPDCSAGSGNTIKFEPLYGLLTDGGAINTLTEEEIAVAAAKGWTVSFA